MRASILLLAAGTLAGCGAGERVAEERRAAYGEEATRPAPSTPPAPAHVLDPDPAAPANTGLDSAHVAGALRLAEGLPRLRCLLVARHGEILVEHCNGSYRADRYANVKSVSKSVLSALVGTAIRDGHLAGVEASVATLLPEPLQGDTFPGKARITVGHLLTMQSGLERTSGGNYGAWVSSRDWVADALRRPLVSEPGGRMLYSTGNYHLLSAILTRTTGMSTLAYARQALGEPLGVTIPAWLADPQGIYFGGNDMQLTPRAMVAFGELYRNGGRHDGVEVVPEAWVRTSLEPRTRSPWSGDRYGYGWFLSRAGDHPMFYARGYGGQFIFVVPALALTMVTTSDPAGARDGEHQPTLHAILDDWIVPAAEAGG